MLIQEVAAKFRVHLSRISHAQIYVFNIVYDMFNLLRNENLLKKLPRMGDREEKFYLVGEEVMDLRKGIISKSANTWKLRSWKTSCFPQESHSTPLTSMERI